MLTQDKTHFGYQSVDPTEKTAKVKSVFHSVASQYDLMNDLMSFGLHRLWKKITIAKIAAKPGQQILDLAGGTGDLAKILAKSVGSEGRVILSDINHSMLEVGYRRLIDLGIINQAKCVEANAEYLPFLDFSFHAVSMAFGLRNVTYKEKALTEIYRVLKPGGRVVILEFSHPKNATFNSLYDLYSFKVIPWLGKLVTNDKDSYQYLVESIRMHPDQETLCTMMQDAGFEQCHYQNINGGIVAIHIGYKF